MEDKLKQQTKKSNDLSDIVLEKETSNVDKTKKILLFAASMILLFLVALVVMKLFNNAPQNNDNNLAQVGDSMIQNTDESIDQISKKVEDTNNLFQQEPIVDESTETDLKFEEMVRKLKAQDSAVEDSNTVIEKSVEEVTKSAEETKDIFSKKVDQITQSVKKEKEAAAVSVQKAQEILTPVTAPKKVVKAPVKPKVVPKKEIIVSSKIVPAPVETKLSTLSGYFIQVGATSNSFPDKRYLKKIKNAGYDYVVHSMMIKGRKIKKILIGPFDTKNDAKRKLPDIQAKLNPGAYIYRIK